MSFDANSLLASLVVSSIGFVLLAYGRKMGRFPHLIAGFVLLIYPYFVANVVAMLAIAIVALGGLWLAARLGW